MGPPVAVNGLQDFTLFAVFSALSIFAVALFAVLRRMIPDESAITRWMHGSVVLAAASGLLGAREWLPPLLGVVVGNTLAVTGIGLQVLGLVEFGRRRERATVVLVVSALTAGLFLVFTALRPDFEVRVVVISALIAVLDAYGAWELLRARPLSPSRRLAVVVLGLEAAWLLARAGLIAAGEPVAEAPWFNGVVNSGLLMTRIGLPVAMGLMVAEALAELRVGRLSQLEERLRELEARVGGVPTVLWEADPQTLTFSYVSGGCEALTGYTAAEWKAPRFWWSHLHPEDREAAVAQRAARTLEHADHELCYRFLTRDGRVVWLQDLVRVVVEGGHASRLRGVMVDVTALKRREGELLQAKDAAERADHEKLMFLANVSHELRTPMNSVLMMLQLALEEDLEPSLAEGLQVAERSAAALTTILNDLLDLSRIEAGQMELNLQDVDLRDELEELRALFSAEASRAGLTLELELDEALPDGLLCDGARVRQVMTNLLSNAVKYADPGRVVLRAAAQPTPGARSARDLTLALEVEDTGPGVPDEARARIFELFERAPLGRRRLTRGAGLGLAISKGLAERMGGHITLEEGELGGARFVLTLPVRAAAFSRRAPPPPEPEALPALSLLVVEDDPINQYVFGKMLDRLGARYVMAGSGEEALEQLGALPDLDAVLLDLFLPGIDGYETARRMRAETVAPPIFALTANASRESRELAEEAGMQGFLEKPLRLAAMREVLRGLRPAAPERSDGA